MQEELLSVVVVAVAVVHELAVYHALGLALHVEDHVLLQDALLLERAAGDVVEVGSDGTKKLNHRR